MTPVYLLLTKTLFVLLLSRKDYEVVTQKGRKLFLNVCQSVKTETFGLKDDTIAPSEIGAFIRRDHGDFSIGWVNVSFHLISFPTTLSGNSTRP